MAEFLKWAIKQSAAGDTSKSPVHVQALMRRMFALLRHSSPYRRAAAATAFNSMYRCVGAVRARCSPACSVNALHRCACSEFREEEALVSRYSLELLDGMLQMLRYVARWQLCLDRNCGARRHDTAAL
jgi:hypothetical protein